MKRRGFVIGSIGLLLLETESLFAKSVSAKNTAATMTSRQGHIASPYSLKRLGQNKHGVLIFDLDRQGAMDVEVPFAIHKISLDPASIGIGYGIASYSNQIAKIDLKNGKLLAVETFKGRFTFSGHSQISKNGLIYATVSDAQSGTTGLVAIEKKSLAIEEELIFPKTPGLGSLHDLRFLPNEDRLVTTGGQLLIEFDPKAKKISKSHRISFDLPNAVLNHFVFTKHGNFGIQSATFDKGRSNETPAQNGALVLFNGQNEKFRILRQSGALAKHLEQDLFGLCLNADGSIICVASLWDNYLTFWNMESGAFIKGLDFQHPTGVTLTNDRSHFVVTTTDGLRYFNAKSTERVESFESFDTKFAKTFAEGTGKRLFHSTAFTI